jgi:hypothetical protein
MRLLNRSRMTIWRYIQDGSLRGFNVASNVIIPLADIANVMGVTEIEVYNVALTYRLPLWQAYTKGG